MIKLKPISQEEIEKAIERLKLNKQKSKQYNFFGDDNHEKIDIMIDVLENNRDREYIDKKYRYYDSLHFSATCALDYKYKRIDLDEILYPEFD